MVYTYRVAPAHLNVGTRDGDRMDSSVEKLKSPEADCFQSRFWDVADAPRSRYVYIWALCASASLYTSKFILVDLNVHYPFHLFIWQAVGIAAFTLLSQWTTSRPINNRSPGSTRQPWFLPLLLAMSIALSMMFGLITTLHFPNVPTLAQLSVLCFLPEMLVAFVIDRADRSKTTLLGSLFLTASCSGILFGEYRLLVNGMVSWLLAIVFFAASRIIYTVMVSRSPDTLSNEKRLDLFTANSGILIAIIAIWGLGWEDAWQVKNSIKASYVPLLLVNMVTTTVAVVLGKSTLFPTYIPTYITDHRKLGSSVNISHMLGITAILMQSGIIGFLSTLSLRRAYTSNVQLLSFFAAILCVVGTALLSGLRGSRDAESTVYSLMPEDESVESLGRIRSNVSDASGWTNETHVSDAYEYRPAKAGRALLVALLTGATWLLYSFLNFSDKVHAETWSAGAILDTAYVPQRDHDIIISMYKEPTEHVASLISGLRDIPGLSNAHVLIYIKDAEADLEVIERGTGADGVTSLPNLGREGETYLNHIVNRWDDLARQTFFLQADVHNPREFWPRITDYFDPVRTGMLSLGWSGNVCNCYECGDKWDVRDPTGLFPKVYGQINNSTSCDQVLLSYKGQFVVSAQRIRGVKKSVYEDLRDALVNPDSWAHQETYLQGRPDSLNAPQFGFQLERMWNLLFQCSDLDVAFKCPSLLSGSGIGTGRIGGSKEDCQCLDPAR